MLADEAGHVGDREALVLRDGDVAHLVAKDAALGPVDQRLEEVGRDCLYRSAKELRILRLGLPGSKWILLANAYIYFTI